MPRRADDLFGQIATFRALHAAALEAVKGKRRKPGAAAFMANLEKEVLRLEAELRDGSYRPGGYTTFMVKEPKERFISAAPFRDRVVHHALCAMVVPLFERGFIDDSFANREGKGSHRAFARAGRKARHGNEAVVWVDQAPGRGRVVRRSVDGAGRGTGDEPRERRLERGAGRRRELRPIDLR